MSATSASLLDRLQADPRSEAWNRLVAIYAPLIRQWLQRQGINLVDGDDLIQEILIVVVRRLPEFRHNQRVGAFRAWLRAITSNCVREHLRKGQQVPRATGDTGFQELLGQLEDSSSELAREWDREHNLHLTQALLDIYTLQREFQAIGGLDGKKIAMVGDLTYALDLLDCGHVPGSGSRKQLQQTTNKMNELRRNLDGLVVLATHDPEAEDQLAKALQH